MIRKSGRKSERISERGSILVAAILILVALTLIGAVALQSAGGEVAMAGADRSSEEALAIAEAGLLWGERSVVTGFTDPLNPGVVSFTAIVATLPVINDPTLCPEGCGDDWHSLHPMSLEGLPFGRGSYKVAVRVDSETRELTLRSLGALPAGAARLVEIVMTDR